MTDTDPELQALLDQGRRTLFGYLGPYLLHETNNVLTVMSGIRQLMKLSRELPDKVGPMIDGQLAKVEGLMDSLRTLQPESDPASLERLLTGAEQLLRLAGKGRKLQVRGQAAGATMAAARVEPVTLGLLGALLPQLPQEMGGVASVELEVGADGDVLRASLTPCRQSPEDAPESRRALQILERAGCHPRITGAPGEDLALEIALRG